jgi:hypothetical protein
MSVVAFYHKAPPTKDVMARFTMYMASEGTRINEMEVYQVGVNIVCYSKFGQRGPDHTDEGIEIKPGVHVLSAPREFVALIQQNSIVMETRDSTFPSRTIDGATETISGVLEGYSEYVSDAKYLLVKEGDQWRIDSFQWGPPRR